MIYFEEHILTEGDLSFGKVIPELRTQAESMKSHGKGHVKTHREGGISFMIPEHLPTPENP